MIATAAAEVHTVLTSTAHVIVAELLLDTRVVVFHALPMLRVMLPVAAGVDIVDIGVAIDVDVVIAPVHTATPIATARPAADGDTGAERYSGRKNRAWNVSNGGGK